MRKILILSVVLFFITSCTKITIIEVANVDKKSLGNYKVTYIKNELGSKWVSYDWYYTKEGVDSFVSESDKNLSEWILSEI